MADFVYEPTIGVSVPNITVENQFYNGVHIAYRLTANPGYVMYDQTEQNTTLDPDTMEEIPIIYYYRQVTYPIRYAPEVWQNRWIAVPENTVPADQIFGGGNTTPTPEVM